MSDADWDADDFEPETSNVATKPVTDKWEGEDEDDDVKDSWDKDSEEEDSKGSEDSGKAIQRKKKKKMAEIIAEKEAAKLKEMEEKAAAQADKDFANTPEGKAAQKLREQKLAEIENLELAKDMFGVSKSASGSIDKMIPEEKEEFDVLSKAIVDKVQLFAASSHYSDFVEELIKELTLDQSASTLKKIKIHVETLHSTKSKEEKAATKGGKKGKSKGSTVKMDLTKDIFSGGGGGNDYDEFDDFM